MSRFWAEKRFLSIALVITVAISNLYISPAQATLGVISSTDAIGVYMDQPYVQGSYLANNYPSMTLTDTYSATASGDPCPTTGNVGTYSYSDNQCKIIKRIHGDPGENYIFGGALTTSGDTTTGTSAGITAESQSDSPAIYDVAGTTITFAEDKNYVGLWWSAGSLGNSIRLYQNSALILTLSVNDVCEIVRGSGACAKPTDNSTLTAIDSTTTYAKSNYFGHPYAPSTMASGEPFIYIHIFTQNSIKFNKIVISADGNGFEFDNLTVGNLSGAALTPKSSLVPVASYGSTYSLTYNSQGGTSVDTQTLVSGGQVSITSTIPTKSGYIFSSWNTNEDGSGETYASSATYPADGTVNSDATLYAQWTGPCSTTTTTTDTTTLVAFKSTTECTYTFPAGLRTATALLVGGGGGGGGDTAGGGGGGAVETQTITANSETWTVRVGVGGSGGSGASIGSTGGTTSFSTGATSYSAVGGSGGHNCNYNGSHCIDGLGGAGGVNSSSVSSGNGGTGGYNGASRTAPTAGANGISNSITGTAISYGAGGGGGQGGNCDVGSTAGGTYGGGTGYICSDDTLATAGQNWFGGGGGGGGTNGARGGNGVIYIQYVTPVQYTITSSADVNGTISASGTTTVYSGDNQSYTFSPSANYKISNVLVDGISQGAITSYRFSNVVANHTISVVFEKIASTTTPTYVPQKSAEQIAAEAAAQKIVDEKAAELLAVQEKALADTAEADKAFKTLQEQLTTLLNTGVFPKLPTTKNPSTTSNTSKAPSSTKTETSKSEVSVPEGTVLITPNQIATLDIEKIGSGGSANIAISQLKSGQRVRVTVISKADLNTKVVDLNSTQITTITPGPIKPSPAINPTLIDIKPAPKTSKAAPNKAEISVSGVKKNQRVRVTVKSK